MKLSRRHILIFIYIAQTFFASKINAQDNKLSYQVILETNTVYNDKDSKSKVNMDNWMNITDFTSQSDLYPIFTFNNKESDKMDVKLQAEGDVRNYNLDKDSTLFSFQELYGQLSFNKKHYLVFGKKRLDWGTGMIWNPTNFFIQKDPLRTQNRLEGIFMLNYSYLFATGAINVYFFPENKLKESKLAIKYDYSNERIDGSVSFVQYGKYQQIGYDLSYGGNFFTLYSEGVVRNFTKSYLVDNTGNIITPDEQSKTFRSELVAGTTIMLNTNLSINAEYRFREDYLSKKQFKNYMQFSPTNPLLFDPISVGKHTLFGNMSYMDTYGKWTVNLRAFFDPVSNQLLLSPLGTITLKNFQIELSSMIYNHSMSIFNSQYSILLSYYF